MSEPKYSFPLLPSTHSDSSWGVDSHGGNLSTSDSSFMTPGSFSTSLNNSSFITPGSKGHIAKGTSRSTSISAKTPQSCSRVSSGSTPGSRMRHDDRSATIVAVVEGRGLAKGEVGLASIDLKRPEVILSQFPDTQTYVKVMTKLLILEPIEVLMPNTVCDSGTKTKLYQLVCDQFTEASLTTVQRKYFNESKGLEYVRQLCAQEFSTVELDISTKYYCLAAVAALLKYVEFIQNMMFAPNSLRVSFKGSEHTVMIDVTTVKNLELLSNTRDPKTCHSLFGLLNFTKTPCGARLLRSNILEPPSPSARQCASMMSPFSNYTPYSGSTLSDQELTDNEGMFFGLESVLRRFLNVDQLISFCVQVPKRETPKTADTTIGYVIYLKHTLQLVEPLRKALTDAKNPLIKACYEVLDDPRFGIILSKIDGVVHDDTHYQKGALNIRTQKCFCIKSGINGMLDITRQLYSEVIDDITLMVEQLSDKHDIPLKSAFSTSRGFYMQTIAQPENGGHVKKGSTKGLVNRDQLPDEFIKVSRQRNTLSFTTFDLMRLNTRANDALSDIYRMSYVVLKELLSDVRSHIGCLYKLTECMAMLDMLHSFAHSCTVSNYVRPEFTDTLAIKQGRHPMLEKIACEPPIPNNAYASSSSNFNIITGPNMAFLLHVNKVSEACFQHLGNHASFVPGISIIHSGKSTFLRQIVLLQILAQMGSFVPAEYASFRLANQIFSRIGSDDDLETNASTFMVEMREVHYILQNVDSTSLIIIDELGRGTSSEEGVGLCQAICEELLITQAITFFATHFLELTKLEKLYPNVENYHFEIKYSMEEGTRQVTYTHVLAKGKTEERHYGLQLARLCMDPSVVTEAHKIANKIQKDKQENEHESIEPRLKRAVYTLATRLVQVARNSLLDQDSLRVYLSHLKKDHLSELEQIRAESTAASPIIRSDQTRVV